MKSNRRKILTSAQKRGQQLVHDGAESVKESVCTWKFLLEMLKTLGLILIFYCFSIGLTFYNKAFIKEFRFPLSITTFHFMVKYALSALCRFIWECYTKEDRIILGWKDYCAKISATGVSCSLDIALSNWSFEFITVSLYTMTKSTAIVFILLFAVLFRLERPRASLIVVVLCIALGLFLFTYHATQFHVEGFLMVLSASFLSGLRWTTAQLFMQKKELGLSHPLDMMYHIQPWMLITILPLAIIFEGVHLSTTSHLFAASELQPMLRTVGLMCAGAVLAFGLELSEYLLLVHTSSLTLSIAGVFKEVCTLYLAAHVNNDRMNGVNAIGLCVCVLGIVIHVILKAINSKSEKATARYRPLSTVESSGSETELFDRSTV